MCWWCPEQEYLFEEDWWWRRVQDDEKMCPRAQAINSSDHNTYFSTKKKLDKPFNC